MREKRKPKQASVAYEGKQPRAIAKTSGKAVPPTHGLAPLEAAKECLAWRLAMMDLEGPWGWSNAEEADLIEIQEKLGHLESESWASLAGDHHHRIEVGSIITEAQERLRQIRRDDLDHLWSIRLTGKKRVWGILHGAAFYVLWWDPHHQVCPAMKKHT